jgi:hypothetical protein
MGRTVLAIAAGVLVGLFIAWFANWASRYAFPPSVLVDMKPALGRTMPMPIGEVVLGLIGWVIAALAGGAIAVRIARSGDWPAWATAALLAMGVILVALMHPQPLWFVILCVAVVAATGFGAGWLSARSAEQAAA